MQFKNWAARIALGILFFAGVLACRVTDELIAQGPTVTPTRTPRPTFTPIPLPTQTTAPSPTAPPTNPPPTLKPPTLRPSPIPTKRPNTAPPPQPTSPAKPTTSPFQYAANPATCVHAGNQYIKGKVYDSKDPNANGVGGLKMAMGGADGNNAYVTTPNEYDGFYTFTLTTSGSGAQAGTYYIWILDGSGRRISDVGGPINMNPVGPDAPGACWAGSVDFWRR